ncbi:MAG: hypothetical protein OXG24_04535 [Gammaproteobacteria bacterium]|nr:hypothetical protein [Gammaproteobacteria bacterium]
MTQENVTNGRFRWEINYRTLRGDEGLSVRLLGPVKNKTKELARFDCFQNSPHYHTAVYDHNTIRSIENADPVSWFLDHVRDGFGDLVARTGGDAPTELEISNHTDSYATIENRSRHMVENAAKADT